MGRTPSPLVGPAWYRDLVEAYLRSLKRRGSPDTTLRTYRWVLQDFGRWVGDCRLERPEHLVPASVWGWQDGIHERIGPSSQKLAASTVRGLLRWGSRQRMGIPRGLWEEIDSVRAPETLPRALDPAALKVILAHYARPRRDLDFMRDRALFIFLLTTGSRITAALSLDRVQHPGPLIVRQKGGGEHELLPSATARAWLDQYLAIRGRDDQAALFVRVGRRGRHRLTDTAANAIWTKLTAELGLRRFTNHQLKHTAVTELGERGASDVEVAKHVGWKNPTMAMRYRQLREARHRELVDALDDLVPAVPVEPVPRRRRRPRMKVLRGDL